MALEAFSVFARRYAEEARRLADKEQNVVRRTELETISLNCAWVAENPPRTFWEALQVQWFIVAVSRLEQHIGAGASATGAWISSFFPTISGT